MAKKKRQNLMEREKNRKGDGTISRTQLLSCYVSSLIIVVLCVWEGLKPETQENGDPTMYFILAALGVVYSVIITIRNHNAKKKAQGGNRLK